MKRSLAPSILFKKRKLAGDDSMSLLHTAKMDGINHLDLFTTKTPSPSTEDNEPETVDTSNNVLKNFVINSSGSPEIAFAVSFKNTKRFAKTDLSGHGVLIVGHSNCQLYNMEGKIIGKAILAREPSKTDYPDYSEVNDKKQTVLVCGKSKKENRIYIYPGNTVSVGSKLLVIKFQVGIEEFTNGTFFLRSMDEIEEEITDSKSRPRIWMPSAIKKTGFRIPYKSNTVVRKKLTKPLHSPNDPNAIVLWKPKDLTSPNRIHIVIDPRLGQFLRPHQIQGVQFLFDCAMGLRGFKGNGCILADDMGLGKTIQAITLIWTLMCQGMNGEPSVRKTVIVCPTSLVGNWGNEFKKWIGEEYVDPIPFGEASKVKAKKALARFAFATDIKDRILVASYDQLRIHIKEISKIPGIDLVICDEGHKLKNASSKTSMAVNMLQAKKRIILSGTPIQNDLEEFHAMVSFVNPGILRDVGVFRTVYSERILVMREPDSAEEDKLIGRERSLQLSKITSEFILRRTSTVNRKYLPPKVDHIVFCKLSPLQESIYKSICKSFESNESDRTALALITDLKKLSNDPSLIYENYKALFPPEFKPGEYQPKFSSKLYFVDTLLQQIRSRGRDKVVIVSNYTQTLSILANMCEQRKWDYFQLDGSLQVTKRQKLVDLFNQPSRSEFVFLLSSKAGGCGLNLVGANHLILFDPDWNPANDAQAMARVWRPGQTKKVYLYRTLSTGTIDEKIFQRQVAKLSLADSVVHGDADAVPDFSQRDLRDIFNYRGEETACDTHDLLNCRCAKNFKKIPLHKRQAAKVDELSTWEHYDELEKIDKHDYFKNSDQVSFVFLKETDPSKEDNPEEVQEVELTFDVEDCERSNDGDSESNDEENES